MTPIKYLLLVGTSTYTVDFAGTTRLIAVSPNPFDARFVAEGLGQYHGVPVRTYVHDSLPGITLQEA